MRSKVLGIGLSFMCSACALLAWAADEPSERHFGEFTVEPSASPAAESANISIKNTKTGSCEVPDPTIQGPVAKVDDFGAKGDGITDDTDAIIAAIRSLRNGGTVVFSPGKTYVKWKTLVIDRPDTYIWGYGATVYTLIDDGLAAQARDRTRKDEIAANKVNANLSIWLTAPRTGVYGLTVISNLRTRLVGTPATTAVFLGNADQRVIDNRFEYTQNGVLAAGATNFVIARNVVYRTSADGIHISHGRARAPKHAGNGRIICNVVRENGDDMIAVVSYGKGEPHVRNVLIEGNDVSGSYWGSGIAVAGGRDVTIRRNTIGQTPVHAGIRLAAEKAHFTSNVVNILIEDNEIEDVETTRPTYSLLGREVLLTPPYGADWGTPGKAIRRPPHAAIDISGQAGDQKVSRVLVRRNTITRAFIDGIRVSGNCTDIHVAGNHMQKVGREAIRIQEWPGDSSSPEGISCVENSSDGVPTTSGLCARAAPTSRATGAEL